MEMLQFSSDIPNRHRCVICVGEEIVYRFTIFDACIRDGRFVIRFNKICFRCTMFNFQSSFARVPLFFLPRPDSLPFSAVSLFPNLSQKAPSFSSLPPFSLSLSSSPSVHRISIDAMAVALCTHSLWMSLCTSMGMMHRLHFIPKWAYWSESLHAFYIMVRSHFTRFYANGMCLMTVKSWGRKRGNAPRWSRSDCIKCACTAHFP